MRECARCGGQMITETDMHGKYLNCMQCGDNINITTNMAPHASSVTGKHADIVLHLPSKRFMRDTTL